MTEFAFPFLWGLVVLSAFIGWGRVAARLAGAAEPDWGLSAGWGMALLVAIGGVLGFFGLAMAPVLFGLVFFGVAAHLAGYGKWRFPFKGWSVAAWGLMAVVAVVMLAQYSAVVSLKAVNCPDDEVAYFTFISRLLQTGAILEPFSLRRLATFGGHTFLQSLVVMAGTEENAFLLDRGIGALVAMGLVAGFLRGAKTNPALPYIVAMVLTVFMPLPFGNSSSHLNGFVFFLTLFRTLHLFPLTFLGTLPGTPWGPGPRRLWLIGMIGAGMSALKAPMMVAAAAAIFFYWLIPVLLERENWRRAGAALGHLGLSASVFLIAWMGMLYRSSGTVLYPLFGGNNRPEYASTYWEAVGPERLLELLWDYFSQPLAVVALTGLVIHVFRRGDRASLALYLGALVVAAATATTLTNDTALTQHRFVAPALNAALVATVIHFLKGIWEDLAEKGGTSPMPRAGDAIFIAFALLMAPYSVYHNTSRLIDGLDARVITPQQRAAYAEMQAAVPRGERMLAIIDQAFALDYTRNTIFNIDMPGGASPDPGMPFFKGPRALKEYLIGQSVRYVAFRDFETPDYCLYRRDVWVKQARGISPQWRQHSKYYLDLFDTVTELAKSETMVYRKGGLSVMRLR